MDDIRNTDRAATYVGLGRSTLEKMRCTGDGPKFIRLGSRRVAYRQRDLDEWLDARPRCASTSEVETTPGPGRPRKRAAASIPPAAV